MHYLLEIIMPPVPGIEMPTQQHIDDCVSVIMAPYHEENEDPEEARTPKWWDWYVVGGRYAGSHMMATLDREKMAAFEQWLQDTQVTVSGIQAGKQELSPKDQIPVVDAKWAEFFPEYAGQACPLFRHSNDQYGRDGNGTLPEDVLHFRDVPREMTCCRVIIAGPNYEGTSMEAKYMISEDIWNGVTHVKSDWDGKIGSALNQFMERAEHARDEWREKYVPTDNWLVVTVDYHS